jgi:hypothetical protein
MLARFSEFAIHCQSEKWVSQGITTSQPIEPIYAEAGACVGYITGVLDGITTSAYLSQSALMCLPKLSSEQIVILVRNYLDAHPQYLHRGASIIVIAALGEAFPCGKPR